MSQISHTTSLNDFALIACAQLKKDGIDVVLTGGAVVWKKLW